MLNIQILDEDIDVLIQEHNNQEDVQRHWSFDEQRRHVLRTWDDVQACPGSGKTTLVAAKLLILAQKWKEAHRGICVLTHTNVAKDEILSKIQNHPAGYRLSSYPHFIGTIQDFVGTFLGRPFCRSSGCAVNYIDDEKCVEVLEKTLGHTAKTYISNQHTYSLHDLKIVWEDGSLKTNMPPSLKNPDSDTYKDLKRKKGLLITDGYYFYSEMYAFAQKLINDNPTIIEAIQKRFPVVLVDEMQDTQKFQDELINSIFLHDDIKLQRLGDPDQAIFNGMGEAHPNESYNNSTDLHVIGSSHRFGDDICNKIIGLSFNHIPELTSDRATKVGNKQHTILTYSDETKGNVLAAFSELVENEDTENRWSDIRVLGGVKDERGIQGYWDEYDISKSSNNFKPKKFIDALHLCCTHNGHTKDHYSLLMGCVVELLRMQNTKITNAKGRTVYYTQSSLQTELEGKQKFANFRQLLTKWIISPEEAIENWPEHKNKLKSLLNIPTLTPEAEDYLGIPNGTPPTEDCAQSSNNEYTTPSGKTIKVGTIHSAKGETHDATLVLETKYSRWFDISETLDYLIDKDKERPAENLDSPTSRLSILAGFHKRLYVACSRPRHLLCLALHEDHINDEQKESLIALGWNIHQVGAQNE